MPSPASCVIVAPSCARRCSCNVCWLSLWLFGRPMHTEAPRICASLRHLPLVISSKVRRSTHCFPITVSESKIGACYGAPFPLGRRSPTAAFGSSQQERGSSPQLDQENPSNCLHTCFSCVTSCLRKVSFTRRTSLGL